jgi:outer membrane protein insertion porin family
MGNINLRERNLLGLGIIANAKSNISGKRNSYEGSVTYPWMFDLPLSGTIRGYKSHGKEQNYAREGEGFGITVGFPVYGLWSMSAGIARDASKLSGFDKGFAQSVVGYYRGYNSNPDKFVNFGENSMSLTLSRDTRDSSAIPSFGARVSVGSRWTGFGGDVAFTNYFSEAVYYQRLFWKAIFKFKANAALLTEFRDDPIPFDRRMMLGGISSIRGYRQSEIGPKDRFGNTLGGDRSLYQNLEVMFPIIESMKLSGVVFMDTGNAWNAMESAFPKEIKSGVGLGVRWVSPMGPVRFEYGWKIKPEVGEEPGAFAFGMGQLF